MIGHPLKHLPRSLGKHFLVNLTVVSLLSLAPFTTQSAEAGGTSGDRCAGLGQGTCNSGLYCYGGVPVLYTGTCGPRVGVNATCFGLGQGNCSSGLECDPRNSRCANVPRRLNQPCSLYTGDFCASDLYCKTGFGALSGTCARRGDAGDACTSLQFATGTSPTDIPLPFQRGTCKGDLECDINKTDPRTCANRPRLENQPCGVLGVAPCDVMQGLYCFRENLLAPGICKKSLCPDPPSKAWNEFDGAEPLSVTPHVAQWSETLENLGQSACPQTMKVDRLGRTFGAIPKRQDDTGVGVRIESVVDDSSAAEAGLQPDDLLGSINGHIVKNLHDYFRILGTLEVGQVVRVTFKRDQELVLREAYVWVTAAHGSANYELADNWNDRCYYYHPDLGYSWLYNKVDDGVNEYVDVRTKVEGKEDDACDGTGPLGQKMCHGLYLGSWGRTDRNASTIGFLATGQGGTRSAVTGAKALDDIEETDEEGWREGNFSLQPDAVFSKLVQAGRLSTEDSAVILGFDLAFNWTFSKDQKNKILQGYYDLLTSRRGVNTERVVLVGASRGGCLSLRLAKKMRESSEWDGVNIIVVGVDAVCNELQGEMGANPLNRDCNPLIGDPGDCDPDRLVPLSFGWNTDIDSEYPAQHDLHILQIAGGYGATFTLGGHLFGIGHALSAQNWLIYTQMTQANAATFCIGDFYKQRWVDLNHDDVCTRPDSRITGVNPDRTLGNGRTVVDYALDFINENWDKEQNGGSNTSAPRALCRDVRVEATDPSCTVSREDGADVNDGSWDPDGAVTLSYDPPGPYSLGPPTAVTLTASQGGQSQQCTGFVKVVDTAPPAIDCPAPQTVECTGREKAPILFEIGAEDCSPPVESTCAPSSGALFDLGDTAVTCSATDALGNESVCGVTMRVVDTTPPDISSVVASPATLWPPNHKMNRIDVEIAASDICDPAITCRVIEVVSDEPDAGTGEDDVPDDTKIVDPTTVELRAERADDGDGRVYTITVECVDGSGNVTRATTAVTVPHNKGGRK